MGWCRLRKLPLSFLLLVPQVSFHIGGQLELVVWLDGVPQAWTKTHVGPSPLGTLFDPLSPSSMGLKQYPERSRTHVLMGLSQGPVGWAPGGTPGEWISPTSQQGVSVLKWHDLGHRLWVTLSHVRGWVLGSGLLVVHQQTVSKSYVCRLVHWFLPEHILPAGLPLAYSTQGWWGWWQVSLPLSTAAAGTQSGLPCPLCRVSDEQRTFLVWRRPLFLLLWPLAYPYPRW